MMAINGQYAPLTTVQKQEVSSCKKIQCRQVCSRRIRWLPLIEDWRPAQRRLIRILLVHHRNRQPGLLFDGVLSFAKCPSVQKFLLDKYLGRITTPPISDIFLTQKLHLYWKKDRLEITGFKIVDPYQNEMDYDWWTACELSVLQYVRDSGQINIDGVSLDSAKVNWFTFQSQIQPKTSMSPNHCANKCLHRHRKQVRALANIGEIVLTNSFYVYAQSWIKTRSKLGLIKIILPLNLFDSEWCFSPIGDTIKFNFICSMVGEEVNHQWHQRRKHISEHRKAVWVLNLSLKAGQLHKAITIVLKYNSMRDMADFVTNSFPS